MMSTRTTELHPLVLALLAALCVLATAARRYPRIRWLAPFRIGPEEIPEDLQRRIDSTARTMRRSQAAMLVVLGLAVPVAHIFLSAMTMSDPLALDRIWLPAVCTVALIGLGVWGLRDAREK